MNKVSKRIALLGVISPALFAVGAMAQPIQLHSTLAGNNPNIVIGGVESAKLALDGQRRFCVSRPEREAAREGSRPDSPGHRRCGSGDCCQRQLGLRR